MDREERAKIWPALEAAIAKSERARQRKEERLEREQRQRDMGVGYLIHAARLTNRISQRNLASRVGATASAICRWESGSRVPSLRMLQRIAQEQGYEVMIGLWDAKEKEPAVLGVIEHELPVSELDLIVDNFETHPLRPTPWKKKLGLDGWRH